MMLNNNLLLTITLLTALIITSCDKAEPEVPDTPELITTVNYTLTPVGDGTAITLSFKDLDGDGGNAATIVNGTLAANQTYTGTLELLNESVSPVEDITAEIREEDEEHQFFFQSDNSNLTVEYNDSDADGNPIGLSSTLTTGEASSGNLTIILRHEPMKSAEGVSGGDITNAIGETDIQVTFQIDVQ